MLMSRGLGCKASLGLTGDIYFGSYEVAGGASRVALPWLAQRPEEVEAGEEEVLAGQVLWCCECVMPTMKQQTTRRASTGACALDQAERAVHRRKDAVATQPADDSDRATKRASIARSGTRA